LSAPEDPGVDSAELLDRITSDAEAGGYNINPDPKFAGELAEGIARNVERYSYPLCPCRLSGGSIQADMDIICPCDYRDDDLAEYDTCY
jgi:ferredoxin-thioredoxin reductase catalytic subunit